VTYGNITSIGINAFYACSSLQYVTPIPSTVTTFSNNMFNDTVNAFENITIPNGITTIPDGAF